MKKYLLALLVILLWTSTCVKESNNSRIQYHSDRMIKFESDDFFSEYKKEEREIIIDTANNIISLSIPPIGDYKSKYTFISDSNELEPRYRGYYKLDIGGKVYIANTIIIDSIANLGLSIGLQIQ